MIRQLGHREQLFIKYFPLLMLLVYSLMFFLAPGITHAQVDTSKFDTAAKKVVEFLRNVTGPSIVVLIPIGAFFLLWSGFSPNIRRIALSIIGTAFVGGILIYLLADPLSNMIIQIFGTSN